MTVLGTIQKKYDEIFAAEKKVADYILANPEQVVMSNVSDLASLSNVSDATVIRMCKHVGYEGYYQMKLLLSHDLGRTQISGISQVNGVPKSVEDFFKIVANNLMLLSNGLNQRSLMACIELIRKSEFVHIVAIGNTSPLSADMAFRLGRLGIRTTTSDVPEYFLNNVNLATTKDLVIGISHSGSSKTVIKALEMAKEKGIPTISICSQANSPMNKFSDYCLFSPGNDRLFSEFGITSHIFEYAIIDLLLYLIANGDSFNDQIDQVEMILSEYKV